MKEVKKLRFKLGFQVETNKGPVDLYSVNAVKDVSGTYVQSTDYDDILRERNELAARVERLRGAANALLMNRMGMDEWYALESALKETPAQSLEAVKREWKEKLAEHCRESSYLPDDRALQDVILVSDVLSFET